jgi:hypothetical protein
MAFGARPTAGNEMRRMDLAVLPEPNAEGVYSSPEIAPRVAAAADWPSCK